MATQTQTNLPLTLTSHEVEEAFMAACADHAFRDPHKLANLSQAVCFWHRLDDAGRSHVLQHIKKYFPVH